MMNYVYSSPNESKIVYTSNLFQKLESRDEEHRKAHILVKYTGENDVLGFKI